MNIYIGNIPNDVTEEELTEVFHAYGHVEHVKIIKDKYTGESRGFGFVEMPDKTQAQAALTGIRDVKGRAVTINEAQPQENFSGSRGFGPNKKKQGFRQRSNFSQRASNY